MFVIYALEDCGIQSLEQQFAGSKCNPCFPYVTVILLSVLDE